jgi:chromosome segregation ATPase
MSKVGEQEQMIKNLQGELSSCNSLKNQEVSKSSNLQVEIKMFKDDIHKKEQEKHEIEKNYLIKIKELQEQIKELERDTKIKLDEISKANESLTVCRQEIASATVSDKKLPYKKLYNEAMDKISEIEQNMNKTHVKLARNKTIRYLQQLLYKLDVHV